MSAGSGRRTGRAHYRRGMAEMQDAGAGPRPAAELDAADARLRELASREGMSAWCAGLIDGMAWTRPGRRQRSPVRLEPTEGAAPDAAAMLAEIAACDEALASATSPNRPRAWVAGVRTSLQWVLGRRTELPAEPDDPLGPDDAG